MKLSEACEAYLSDMQARHLRDSTRKRYKSLFRSWQSYAGERGLTDLTSFDQAEMRAWRESWICKPGTQRLQLKLLRAFFTHTVDSGWIRVSPVAKLKAPRAPDQPTMPLSRDEVVSLITAATEAKQTQRTSAHSTHALLRSLDPRCRHATTGRHRHSQQPYIAARQERRAGHGSTAQPSDRGP